MTIIQQINKNRDEIRCGFCSNLLVHTTKIHPIKLENRQFKNEDCYGVLCDDCFKNGMEPNFAVVFLGLDNEKVTYIKTTSETIFTPKLAKKVEKIEEKLTELQEQNVSVPSTSGVVVAAAEGNEAAKEAISVDKDKEDK